MYVRTIVRYNEKSLSLEKESLKVSLNRIQKKAENQFYFTLQYGTVPVPIPFKLI